MNMFTELLPQDLYHTYIVMGHVDSTPLLLQEYLEEQGHISRSSSDLLVQTYDSFTISDSKTIKEWASVKRVGDGKKVCIISTKFINREAEQSLLKVLEEPGEGTHFFIIVPPSVVLLDTTLSRAQVVNLGATQEESGIDHEAQKFMHLTPKDRIEYVATMIKRHEDDETSGGLRHEALNLINGIEKSLHEKLHTAIKSKDKNVHINLTFIFGELAKAREYLNTSGASVKMIIEHIALML
jgi:DNA polymerase III, delta subunit